METITAEPPTTNFDRAAAAEQLRHGLPGVVSTIIAEAMAADRTPAAQFNSSGAESEMFSSNL